MASFADTLLTATSDVSVVHRRVVRVGAVCALFATLVFIGVGIVAGNSSLLTQAAAPLVAAVIMIAQIALQRENGAVALGTSAVIVMVFYTLMGNQSTILPASVALVIICALAMVFVETRIQLVVAGVASLLFLAPQVWDLDFGEALVLGAVMSLTFAMTAVIFVSVRSATAELHTRFQMLFEHSPTAVLEEDWSEAISYVRSEYMGRPDRIRAFLLAYPAVVRRAVARANILRANRAAFELLEVDDPNDLLGYRDPSKVNDETLEAFVEALVTLYEQETTFEYELEARTFKGRPIWIQTRAVDTSPDASGQRIIMGLADISHIKERNEAMGQLVKSKDEFIARVSHELRTPLTAVVGLTSEMATTGNAEPEEQAELLDLVAAQAAEMSYIVEDLLVAARAEIGTVAIDNTMVDLGKELRSTVEGLGMTVEQAPEISSEIRADPSRVRQILRNLLTNADRYGGPRVRVEAGETDELAWLEVRDDGDGVPDHLAEAIFDSYVTAHPEVTAESVGLGLSVARQLAEMMNGSLTYRRDDGETVFRLELPVASRSERNLASNLS